MYKAQQKVSFGFTEKLFPAGTHMCYIYDDEMERRKIMAKFIESGLGSGEKVAYLAAPSDPKGIEDSLAILGVKLPATIRPGQMLLADAEKTYCPDRTFVPERTIETWRALYARSRAAHFSGMRGAGEMAWIHKGIPGIERWFDYEAMLNLLVRQCPFSGIICQYDAGRLNGEALYTLLTLHPLMLVRGQIAYSPYYRPPEHWLADFSLNRAAADMFSTRPSVQSPDP